MIKTKDEYMRTFLTASEYPFWKKGKSVGIFEHMAKARHKEHNKRVGKPFWLYSKKDIWG